jgi:hypothetical protein
MKTYLLAAAALAGAALVSPAVRAQAALGDQSLAPNAVIYLPQLPTPVELSKFAATKSLSIVSIQQVNGEELFAYRSPDGATNNVTYRVIPSSGATAPAADPAAAPAAPAAAVPVVGAGDPGPGVVYTAPAPTTYYNYDYPYYAPGYYPWGWYPGGYVGIGFGYRGGWGFRGGWGGWRGGGWRR